MDKGTSHSTMYSIISFFKYTPPPPAAPAAPDARTSASSLYSYAPAARAPCSAGCRRLRAAKRKYAAGRASAGVPGRNPPAACTTPYSRYKTFRPSAREKQARQAPPQASRRATSSAYRAPRC